MHGGMTSTFWDPSQAGPSHFPICLAGAVRLNQLLLVRIPMRCGLQRRELALRARGGHSSAASAGKRLAAGSDRRPGRGAAKLLDI